MLGEHDMAMNHYRQALHFDPEHASVKAQYRTLKALEKHRARGEEHAGAGRHAEAVASWRAAIAVDAAHRNFIAPTSVDHCPRGGGGGGGGGVNS